MLVELLVNESSESKYIHRVSDFFQDWWAEVTHGGKNG